MMKEIFTGDKLPTFTATAIALAALLIVFVQAPWARAVSGFTIACCLLSGGIWWLMQPARTRIQVRWQIACGVLFFVGSILAFIFALNMARQ